MKQYLMGLILLLFLCAPGNAYAQQRAVSDIRLQQALTAQTTQGMENYLSAPDKFGTPLIIKLARQGDMKTLTQLSSKTQTGDFLLAKDLYGNNIFHSAKDAHTIQTLAALIRHYYGAKALSQIRLLMDARNQLGETPLHTQINAGHTETFAPIYAYTTLKQKNDQVKNQIARLRGMDERIVAQHQAIYCQEIKTLGSGHGQTLLQAARALSSQQPQMGKLAGHIQRDIPCLML